MASQTDFTLERAAEIKDTVEDMLKGIPKSRRLEYLGHLNDILLFIGAAENAMKNSGTGQNKEAKSE